MISRYEQKLISVYSLAKAYLIDILDNENASAMLGKYLTPHEHNQPEKLSDIYFQLLRHAQNSNMKPKVIGESIGGVENLKKSFI